LLESLLKTIAPLGGAAAVVGAFAAFLGSIWAHRIKQATVTAAQKDVAAITAKAQQDLASLSAEHTRVLEAFKAKAAMALKEREAFAGLSAEFYQQFLSQRVAVYRELLRIGNDYRKRMEENFLRQEFEDWHEEYVSIYREMLDTVAENQLYVSNEAEASFQRLRVTIAPHLNEADRAEAYALGHGADHAEADRARADDEQRALRETVKLMDEFIEQVRRDVAKIRSRIEMDSPAPLL